MLRKQCAEYPNEPVQQVLGQPELVGDMVGVFQRRVEAISNLVMRRAKVDRTQTPEQVLEATKRRPYVDAKVVKTMPKGEGEEVAVYFFTLGRYVGDADLDKEYELRGLKPADPYTLAQVNTDDPALADNRPNGTHWQNAEGKWCFATFRRWYGERDVYVSVRGYEWDVRWWFAGVRK